MATRTQRLPSLNALKVFWAAARHGSFVKAASELHVTASAVSLQIRQLEDELGLKLFERTPKGLALTAAGSRVLPDVNSAFDRLRATFASLGESEESGAMLTVSAAPSFAAKDPVKKEKRIHRMIKRADLNGDGKISQSEMARGIAVTFSKVDTNGDGALSASEIAGAKKVLKAERKRAKASGEGRLQYVKFPAKRINKRFDKIDANGDGQLSKGEMERVALRMFKKRDKNNDGYIDREERVAALKDFFARLDADGDGKITAAEFAAAHQRRMERRRAAAAPPPKGTSSPSDLDELE